MKTVSKVQHTPGPWGLQEVIPSDVARWTVAPEGHAAIESQTDREPSISIRGGGVDAPLFASGDGPRGLLGFIAEVPIAAGRPGGRETAIANALLIAAAPRLLAALEVKVANIAARLRLDTRTVDGITKEAAANELYLIVREATADARGEGP